jgi:predicted nucleic acid-binding protein
MEKIKFVWDTSALINIKEPNQNGYSPANSLYKDFSNGWISEPYQNIFPSLAVFEVSATVSRMHREGKRILREFYIMNDHSVLYDVNQNLIDKSYDLYAKPGFDQLRGADLVFACIAYIENAWLVTLDKDYTKYVSKYIKILDLNDSRESPKYRRLFE